MPYYKHGNRRLYYALEGASNPIAFLHGYLGTSQTHWGAQFADSELSSAFTLIAPDLRGFGRSGEKRWGEPHTTEELLEDLRVLFFDHLKLEVMPVLVGYSVGAALALEYAIRSPKNVAGLVLVSPRPFVRKGGRSYPFLSKEKRSTSQTRAKVWSLVKIISKRISERSIRRKIKYHPELLARFKKIHEIPVLILFGSEDTVTPIIAFQSLRALLPHAEVVEFPGDHGISHENAKNFNRILIDFCKQIDVK
ncbi:MAG: alpha/beta fold hydrolase [Candidatus Hodarchaeales archaeon]|jgi:pimeloyl-ACP methyl ester carboxylesterase